MIRGSSCQIVKKNHRFILYIHGFFVTLLRKVFEKRAMTSEYKIMTILNYNSGNRSSHLNPERILPSRGNNFSLTEAQKSNRVKSVLSTLMLLMLMVLAPASAWAQSPIIPTTDISEKKLYLIQSQKITSFYMTVNGTKVNTANVPTADMLWYFLDAGIVDGKQYYYIVSNSTGKYISNSQYASKGRLVDLLDFDPGNTDQIKFNLNPNGPENVYDIRIKPNGSGWIALNKESGQVVATNKPIRLTNSDYVDNDNSRWKFIAYDELTWPDPDAPFALSTDETKTYFRMPTSSSLLVQGRRSL